MDDEVTKEKINKEKYGKKSCIIWIYRNKMDRNKKESYEIKKNHMYLFGWVGKKRNRNYIYIYIYIYTLTKNLFCI